MQIARLPDIDEGTWEDVKKYVEGSLVENKGLVALTCGLKTKALLLTCGMGRFPNPADMVSSLFILGWDEHFVLWIFFRHPFSETFVKIFHILKAAEVIQKQPKHCRALPKIQKP